MKTIIPKTIACWLTLMISLYFIAFLGRESTILICLYTHTHTHIYIYMCKLKNWLRNCQKPTKVYTNQSSDCYLWFQLPFLLQFVSSCSDLLTKKRPRSSSWSDWVFSFNRLTSIHIRSSSNAAQTALPLSLRLCGRTCIELWSMIWKLHEDFRFSQSTVVDHSAQRTEPEGRGLSCWNW